jgi:hypothetical protein
MIGASTCTNCGHRFRAPISLGERASNYVTKLPWALTKSLASVALGGDGVVSDPDPLVARCPECDHLTVVG